MSALDCLERVCPIAVAGFTMPWPKPEDLRVTILYESQINNCFYIQDI